MLVTHHLILGGQVHGLAGLGPLHVLGRVAERHQLVTVDCRELLSRQSQPLDVQYSHLKLHTIDLTFVFKISYICF